MILALSAVIFQPTPVASATAGYALGIFGNANEDDAIDMRDVTYAERIILGLSARRPLADARHDGKVDMLDVTHTEMIILGKEKELTLLDERGDAVIINKPVRRVIPEHITSLAAMQVLDAKDKIVSIGSTAVKEHMGPIFLQNLSELPTIGTYGNPDYEAILRLNPDLLIAYRCVTLQEKLPGVTVFYGGYGEPYPPEHLTVDMRKLGYILAKKDRAEAYIDWYNKYMDMIKERTAELSEDEKPKIYVFYPLLGFYMCRGNYPPCDVAGGINIGADLGHGFANAVDPEWVIQQNPDVIIATMAQNCGAYDTDDTSWLISECNKILNLPELQNVTAVKEKKIYFMNSYAMGLFPNYILSIMYYAKWFHPELFKDVNPQEIHQEYLNRFQNIDFHVSEHGVFVYPPPEE